jgi:NADPH:quinone reductase-like Zn-dependent oxidoreductase
MYATAHPETGQSRAGAATLDGVRERTMKAMVQWVYGPPDDLSMREIAIPDVGAHDVLVRVHSAALNVGDGFAVRGEPLPMRLESGLLRPKPGIPGYDVAGVVESVGTRVTRFRLGDAVFGAGRGTCAEYAAVADERLAPKPATLRFEQAAAIPIAGLVALHGLRDAGRLKSGQKVLINGAAGGVGTFAVQIAKALGAHVTGVCSTANVDMVRSIGADEVIDYTREDFTRRAGRYELVFDNVENRPLAECRRVLTPDGTLVLNSGSGARGMKLLVRLLKPLALSPFVRQRLVRYLSRPNYADLMLVKELVETGRVKPVIDRVVPLSETAVALRHIETGHARGKVVVAVRGDF